MKALLSRNFLLIFIGQIISLFGNAILRFALPLHLLEQTDSPMLFGIASACSFVPMILLSPIGGIMADRINKKNMMVALDFLTAGVILIFTLSKSGSWDPVLLILITLILLYGIAGAYQPAVQASIPLFMSGDDLLRGNAAINLVSSLASLIGPVLGGMLYSLSGLTPILLISICCFAFSAVMELFIRLPESKEKEEGKRPGIFKTGRMDLKESLLFISREHPVILKITLLAGLVNLVFSSLITVGLPVMITQLLHFDRGQANLFYGYAEGAIAAGGLAGGLLAGVLAARLSVTRGHFLLTAVSFTLLPMGAGFLLSLPDMAIYILILLSCFAMMVLSTVFTIQVMTHIQLLTPAHLLGKVMSCVLCICMCAQPLGQAVYGFLFQHFSERVFLLFFGAFGIMILLSLFSKRFFACKTLFSLV